MSLTDEQKSKFLRLIATGHLRYEASRAVQSTVPEIKRHLKADPEFASAFEDAQLEASEPVESVLYQAALNKEPWAVKEWLTKRDKERWAEPDKTVKVQHSGSVTLEPGQTVLTAVGGLIEALKERQAIRTGESSTFASLRAPKGRDEAIEALATDRRAPELLSLEAIAAAAEPEPEPEPEPTPTPATYTLPGLFSVPENMPPRPGALT